MYPYRYGKEPVRNQVVIQRVCLLLVVPPAAHPLPSGTQPRERTSRDAGSRVVSIGMSDFGLSTHYYWYYIVERKL